MSSIRTNQRVTIERLDLDPPERYLSRIEGVDSEQIVLACPVRQGAPVPVHIGENLRVTLFHAGGAHAFQTVVVDRAAGQVNFLHVERPQRLEALQRRQFFREPTLLKTICSTAADGEQRVEGVTRNIGGGGLCFRTKDLKGLRLMLQARVPEQPVWVEIELPDHPLCAVADMAWLQESEDGRYADLAMEFLDLAEPERERLIRYLFVLQRDALRKGFIR